MEAVLLTPEKQQLLDNLRHETEEATTRLSAKRDYLRSVRGMSDGVGAVVTMQRSIKSDMDRIAHAGDAISRIERLLAFGFEPTTPPDWYCGHLSEPKEQRSETWPRKEAPSGRTEPTVSDSVWTLTAFSFSPFGMGLGYRVFKGAIPAEAVRRYSIAKPLLDDARIYSPREEDFQFVSLEPADPVLIGGVEVLGQPCYFEIARWDIDRDLAEVFAS